MPIDFPNSPTNGQTHTVGSFTWQYDGEKWIAANGIALDGLTDVTVPSPSSGDFLKWNGTAWVNDAIDLGTDTTGNYVSDVTAGTGVSVTHTPGEGSSPTIAIGQDVGTSASVQFAAVTAPLIGNASTATALQTARVFELSGDVSGSASFDGTSNVNIFTTVQTASVAIGELGGVVITNPEEFQTLEFNGTNWVNQYSSVVTYARNAESTTLTTGTAVYLFGATGDHATVKRADNTTDVTSSKTIGLVGASIAASENGPVITRGYVDGIDLSVGYSPGDVLWLGKNGQFTTTKPSAPDHLVFIGVVVRATNNGIVYVATQNGYEIEELHDVKISSPQNADFLRYNSASAIWVNDQINLGTDTVGNYVVDVSGGTGVTVTHTPSEGSTPIIAIGQAVGTSASVQFAQVTTTGDVTVGGNLTVSGTTTTVNTETVLIADNIITLNSNETSTPTENAGIEVERGTSTNVQIRWNETTDKWQFTNDGSSYVDLGAGGATVSASAPATGDAGSLWLDSVNLDLYVRYDSNWVQLTGEDPVVEDLNDLSDVDVPSPNVGDVLVYDGTYWTSASAGASIEVSASAPASPSEGSLWFDSDTAKTFIYYDSSWVEIGVNDNAARAIVSASAPTSPQEGEMWFNSDDARTYTYYDGVWVELGTSGSTALVSDSAPTNPIAGQIWYKSDTGATYVYYGTTWVEIGAVGVITSSQVTTALGYTPANAATAATTGKAIAMAIVFGG